MKKSPFLTIGYLCILIIFSGYLYPAKAVAQFFPFGTPNQLLPTSYLSVYLNPYYYNTLSPISSFGQFDPSIDLDNVTISLDLLYSPTKYRTYDPASLKGLYNFSPAPFNYIWNSLVDSQGKTTTINPYFATPFYYPLVNKGYFDTTTPERVVPTSLYTLYSFANHLPELFYTASQASLAPDQSFLNALGLSLLPII